VEGAHLVEVALELAVAAEVGGVHEVWVLVFTGHEVFNL
jgi:hypothetical protein